MNEIYKKIDAHGHFGPSFLGPESNMNVYLHEAKKIGVVASIASPGPTPSIPYIEGTYYPCLWSVNEEGLSYFQQWNTLGGEIIKTEMATENPYHDVNLNLFKKVDDGKNDIKILVMPIHHPILDTPDEVRSMLFDLPSVAMKLHGISTFTGPEDVRTHTIDLLRSSNKPIVVHTDIYNLESKSPIHSAYQLNNPEKWVSWANQTGVKTLITHGARLSQDAIRLALTTPNVMIGIAPDLLLMTEPERLARTTDNYLETLLSLVPPEKLLFDIDFGWNVSERNQWDTLDWKMHERIQESANHIGIKENMLEAIFYKNAVKFYNL